MQQKARSVAVLLTEMSMSTVFMSIFAAMSRIIDLSLTKALFNDEAKLLFDFTCIPVLSQVFHVLC